MNITLTKLQQWMIELLKAWNRSSIPPDAAYFVDFVRTRIRRSLRHIPG